MGWSDKFHPGSGLNQILGEILERYDEIIPADIYQMLCPTIIKYDKEFPYTINIKNNLTSGHRIYKYLSTLTKYDQLVIPYEKYKLIGFGDFSHGDNNMWKFRYYVLQQMIKITNKYINIFIEDSPEHANNIMLDHKLILEDHYGVAEGKFPYGPLDRYSYRSWDSPLYLEIIKYIRNNRNRITIIGVDSPTQARDQAMANKILKKMDNDNDHCINFFWAANAHVDAREITENYELKWVPEEKYRAGYYLKKKLKDDYCIILSTGYKGSIRFNSYCSNNDCDERTFPIIPIVYNFVYEPYHEHKSNDTYNIYTPEIFTQFIIEFSDAKFNNNSQYMPYIVYSKSWNYLIFFSSVNKLELIKA